MTIRYWVAVCVSLLLASCGSSEMTMTEYVDALDAIFNRGIERYEAVVASPQGRVLIVGQGEHLGFTDEGAQLTDFTPHDLHLALEQVAEIQAEALEAAAAIGPANEIEDLHALFFRELPIAELAARAGTATDWYELSDSPEMAAYRTALAAENQVCVEFQATLDATAKRGVFAEVPWMPGDLKEIVDTPWAAHRYRRTLKTSTAHRQPSSYPPNQHIWVAPPGSSGHAYASCARTPAGF